MKKLLKKYSITIIVIISINIFFSCESEDLSNLDDLIYVRNKGADMAAYVHGNATEKTFLITLTGGPGFYGLVFRTDAMKDVIEKSYAVVYFDQRGTGMSQGRYTKSDFNIEVMSEDVMVLVKTLQYKYGQDSKFFLLGHSWGGTLATATISKTDNQNYFKGWVNIDGPHDVGLYYLKVIEKLKKVANEQIGIGNHVDYWIDLKNEMDNQDTLSYTWDDVYYMNDKAKEAESTLMEDGVILGGGVAAGIDYLIKNNLLTFSKNRSYVSADKLVPLEISYENELENIQVPSLILWGKYDLTVPVEVGQIVYKNLGSFNKKIVLFEKSGHQLIQTEPDKFAEELLNFINQYK